MDVATVVGADRMGKMDAVAERVNSKIFQQTPMGASVRVGGRLSAAVGGGAPQLTTTDGGVLSLGGASAVECTDNASAMQGFVEVVGTKAGDALLDAAGIVPLGNEVDAELWDEAVKMAQLPQLRSMFAPLPVAA